MSWRALILILAICYFAFSVVYLVMYGFDNPRRAIWIGLIGMIVMAIGMTVRGKKK